MKYPTFTSRPDWFELCDGPHPLKDGLVFAGLGRHPGSTRFHDSSLYGRHGTLTNMEPATDWVSALGRRALDFDGTNDYLVVPGFAPSFITVSMWVYVRSTADFARLFEKGLNNEWTVTLNKLKDSGKTICVQVSDANAFSSTYDIVTDVRWRSVAATINYASKTLRLFVDGAFTYEWSGVLAPGTAGDFYFCGNPGAVGVTELDAIVADPMIWSRILSQPKITALADPGNVMLSLGGSDLLRYRRKEWPVGTAAGGTAYDRTATDSLGLSDALTRIGDFLRSAAEALGLSDAASRVAEFDRAAGDSEGVTDLASKAAGYDRTAAAETLGLTDSASRIAGYDRVSAEALGIADASSRIADFSRSAAEAEGLTDAASRIAEFARAASESEGLADATAIVVTYDRTIADAVGLVDVSSLGQEFVKIIVDSMGITDISLRIAEFSRALSETEGLADVASRIADFSRTASDSEGLTDVGLVTVTYDRSISDAMGLVDVSFAGQQFIKVIADSMGLADVAAGITGYGRTISDTVGIADALSRLVFFVRVSADTEGLTDAVTTDYVTSILVIRALSETLTKPGVFSETFTTIDVTGESLIDAN